MIRGLYPTIAADSMHSEAHGFFRKDPMPRPANSPFNTYPRPRKNPKEAPPPVQEQKIALRALEKVQASRPAKPPGKK